MTDMPAVFGPVPSARQLKWHALELYGFVHFTINTFTDKEWGYGDESPELFDPSEFDADALVSAARDGGLKGLILTCKHHDGFCLWPSFHTRHSVKYSPFRGGKGDVVKEVANACRKRGLKFGVYLSPWDRNHPAYGTPAYLDYYRAQLRELLTGYGNIFEIWFDGANGGDGFYGGAREMRKIDNKTYYDWPTTWELARKLQPDAALFSDAGPDIRWVGNEQGFAGDPCWHTIDAADTWPGHADPETLNRGQRGGAQWLPAEVDVSIRPGWFYHAAEDDSVRSAENLMKVYFESVGRGANLLLNLPPDRRGRIHDNDIASLRAFRKKLDATFAKDLVRPARVTASAFRGNDPRFAPEKVRDGRPETYWSTDDTDLTPSIVVTWPRPVTFDVVRLREFLPLGQRVDAFAIDISETENGVPGWREVARQDAIGAQRLVKLLSPVTTEKLRVRIVSSPVCPAISEIAVFQTPV